MNLLLGINARRPREDRSAALAEASSSRHARERWRLIDLLPALSLAGFSVILLGLPYRQNLPGLPPGEIAIALALATTLPLVLWRRQPELVLLVTGIAYAAYLDLHTQQISGPSLAALVGFFAVGAYGRSRWRSAVRLVVAAGLTAYVALHILGAQPSLGADLALVLVASLSYNVFLYAASWLMGDWYRERALYEEELHRRADQIERERVEREQRVVRDERIRIARELHDVVAHHVSLMGIQAGAARTLVPASPTRATELLAGIESSSRSAVAEMHQLLGALRDEPVGPNVGPTPKLSELHELVEGAQRAGLDVSLEISGSRPLALPDILDLSAYRIVQEALTNTVRHANATRARISVTYGVGALRLSVEDDGVGSAGVSETGGRGLIGMRERAALFGGSLVAGPTGRGYRVEATLPTPS